MTREFDPAIHKDEAHRAIVARVRRLLDGTSATQRELASLLGCDVSSINRALLVDDPRRREWRAWEVYAIAEDFGIPILEFFPRAIGGVRPQTMGEV